MRILIVSPSIPFPPIGGDKLRIYHLLRALAKKHDVTLIGFTYGVDEHFASPSYPLNMITVPWKCPVLYSQMQSEDALSSQLAYEKLSNTPEPFLVSYFESADMEKALQRVTQDKFDLILVEHTYMGRFLSVLPKQIPKILDLHNVHSLIAQRETADKTDLEQMRSQIEATKILDFEKSVAAQCICCLVVSDLEAIAAKNLLEIERVHVIPNGVDTSFFTPTNAPPISNYLLFTGMMNYAPNIEAVKYFTAEILPLIQQQLPEVEFHIVGANPTTEVTSLASQTVIIHGFVPDIRPYYSQAAVVVVPLLHGGGTRLKILEAAACGKAIVSTALGAEGLQFCSGKDLMIADTAFDFAERVVSLLKEPQRRRQLAQQARRACEQYDWDKIGAQLCQLAERITLTATP